MDKDSSLGSNFRIFLRSFLSDTFAITTHKRWQFRLCLVSWIKLYAQLWGQILSGRRMVKVKTQKSACTKTQMLWKMNNHLFPVLGRDCSFWWHGGGCSDLPPHQTHTLYCISCSQEMLHLSSSISTTGKLLLFLFREKSHFLHKRKDSWGFMWQLAPRTGGFIVTGLTESLTGTFTG